MENSKNYIEEARKRFIENQIPRIVKDAKVMVESLARALPEIVDVEGVKTELTAHLAREGVSKLMEHLISEEYEKARGHILGKEPSVVRDRINQYLKTNC
jgi:hypothetical protein